MTKKLTYQGIFKRHLLMDELFAAFPEWIIGEGDERQSLLYMEGNQLGVKITVPNNADENDIQAVIDAHDPNALSNGEQDQVYRDENEVLAQTSKTSFRNIPNWATWTPTEGETYVHDTVLSGMDVAQIEAWIDTNVTSLAEAKDALKLIGGELVDLRNICEKLALAVLYLRDITVRKHDV